ncbi:MAG: DsbA family protein [Porphyrobacter sp.]|nr:DsbA family protein [Porphyrobacter sp.]
MAERRKITDDPVAPKFEPADYDVTIVTYSDYQCPFCRKVHPVLERIAREDGKVRIVYRDWPIFGTASDEAASAAIASQWQGKHAAFNDALMRTDGKLDSGKIRAAANAAGVDWQRLQRDMKERKREIDALIGRTSRQAAEMRLQGTPALLIGPYLIPGAIDDVELGKAVKIAREFEKNRVG